jgi:ADP-heptose:LPS heptosyltransferase
MIFRSAPQPPSILIINPFGIGDVLFTTPLVRAVRRAFPESYLGYLCNQRTQGILAHNASLNELFVYEKDELIRCWQRSALQGVRYLASLLGRIRKRRFHLVIDLSLGERYGLVMRLLGVPKRIGFNYRRRGRFLTQSITIDGYHSAHVVEYYRRLLGFIGIRDAGGHSELPVSIEDARWADDWLKQRRAEGGCIRVGIVPAGGLSWGMRASFRRWAADGFAAVGDALVERFNAQVFLFGEPSDSQVCAEVVQKMRHPSIDVSGQTTLGRFVSLIKHLDLVICNDGGPLHLAVSQEVKTVSLFGPVDPVVYGPYPADPSRHRVVFRPDVWCRPCYRNFRLPPCPYERACLTQIDAADVIQACMDLLQPQPIASDTTAHAA